MATFEILAESGGSSSVVGYPEGTKMYLALLTQSGTNAPVATVLVNTLGGTVVWGYVDVGVYSATLSGAFPSGKTCPFISGLEGAATAGGGSPLGSGTALVRVSDNALNIFVNESSGTPVNDVLAGYPIQVIVLP